MTGSRLLRLVLAALLLPLALGTATAAALTLEPVGPKFDLPTYVTSEPGNPDRLFVAERAGTIEVLENGAVSTFADLSAAVGCPVGGCEGERGLMSIALAPDYPASGRLFAFYAAEGSGTLHVVELTAEADRITAVPGSLVQLLEVPHPGPANHNGGQLQFGPDGDLYVSTGDGGGRDDERHNSQDPTKPLGKILRLDPDASPPLTPTVWSYGLRNPFRFSFDALTGDMTIGDVGQDAHEEIDFAPSPFPGVVGGQGFNYGWNCREGFSLGPQTDPQCATTPATSFVQPVFDYGHDADPDLGGNRCSITGGYVVRDPGLGGLAGSYVYTDFCSGVIRTLHLPSTGAPRASGDCSLGLDVDNPVSFGEDAARRLYVVEQGGQIYRFAGPPPAGCPRPLPPPAQPGAGGSGSGGKGAGGGSQPVRVPSFVGIKAERRRVERGGYALLTVWVSPCAGHRGDPVQLQRDGSANGTKYLSRACTARFMPHIRRPHSYAASTREDETFLAGASRTLRIKLAVTGGRGRR